MNVKSDIRSLRSHQLALVCWREHASTFSYQGRPRLDLILLWWPLLALVSVPLSLLVSCQRPVLSSANFSRPTPSGQLHPANPKPDVRFGRPPPRSACGLLSARFASLLTRSTLGSLSDRFLPLACRLHLWPALSSGLHCRGFLLPGSISRLFPPPLLPGSRPRFLTGSLQPHYLSSPLATSLFSLMLPCPLSRPEQILKCPPLQRRSRLYYQKCITGSVLPKVYYQRYS